MNKCPHFTHLLVFPRLRIQNANAFSGPLTHGFPAVTAFLGLMWALQRKAHKVGLDIEIKAVGMVCHNYEEQAFDDVLFGPNSQAHSVKRFTLTRNPMRSSGKAASIVEEGRIHLDLSLVLGVTSQPWGKDPATCDADVKRLAELLPSMRIAGGTILHHAQTDHPRYRASILDLTGNEADRNDVFRKGRKCLLPGFALVSRPDLIRDRLTELQKTNPQATRLDAWLSLCRVNWTYRFSDNNNTSGTWENDKKGKGWIVPIPVGYAALDKLHDPSSVAGARDPRLPVRFVEALYSIGEWVSPHRVYTPERLLWYPGSLSGKGHYACCNDYLPPKDSDSFDYNDFD